MRALETFASAGSGKGCPMRVVCGWLLLSLFMLGGCGLPVDPRNTSEAVAQGPLKVGITSAQRLSSAEQSVLNSLSDSTGSELETRFGEVHEMVHALNETELHLIISLPVSSPLKKKIGATRPYENELWSEPKRVWAVPPGENAWLKTVETHLEQIR